MSGIDSLNSIMNNYLEKNPSYRLMPKDKLVEKMLLDGIITSEQAEQILKKTSVFGFGFTSFNSEPFEIFGFYKNNMLSQNKNIDDVILKLDKNGKIDVSYYTIDNLKKVLNELNSDYKINNLLNKDSENIGFVINSEKNNLMISINMSNKNNITFFYNKGGKFFKEISIKNGELYEEVVYENNEPKEILYYSNNKPYAKITNGMIYTFLVKDLIDDINAKNSLGLPTTRNSIEENILKRINENNVFEILLNYKNVTNTELIFDIKNEWGLDDDLKNKLINHIKLMTKKSDENIASEYISQNLADEIYGLSNKNLETYVNMINENNVQSVLVSYREKSLEKSAERYVNISKTINTYLVTSLLDDYLQISDYLVSLLPRDFIDNYLIPTEMLLESINEEISISKEKRDKMITHIMECFMKSIDEYKYSDDILRDIEQNKGDIKKLGIDITRLSNRGNLLPKEEIVFEKPNGKLDVPTRQGNVGDCWMVASILSALSNDNARAYLEDYCIEFNEETGDVTINMKGIGVSYIISAKDIENSNHLAQGGGDIRAIEIAVDRFIKEQAYSNNKYNIDIDGNFMEFFYKLFFGNSNVIEWNDCLTKDFNDENMLYTISYSMDNYLSVGNSKEFEEMINLFYGNHAYAIISSDDEYIYLINPIGKLDENTENVQFVAEDFNNFKPFPIKKSLLKELNPEIHETKIPK